MIFLHVLVAVPPAVRLGVEQPPVRPYEVELEELLLGVELAPVTGCLHFCGFPEAVLVPGLHGAIG